MDTHRTVVLVAKVLFHASFFNATRVSSVVPMRGELFKPIRRRVSFSALYGFLGCEITLFTIWQKQVSHIRYLLP